MRESTNMKVLSVRDVEEDVIKSLKILSAKKNMKIANVIKFLTLFYIDNAEDSATREVLRQIFSRGEG